MVFVSTLQAPQSRVKRGDNCLLLTNTLNPQYTDSLCAPETFLKIISFKVEIQARIAQLVAYQLGTGEVPGSNTGKGENFSVKIRNWIV